MQQSSVISKEGAAKELLQRHFDMLLRSAGLPVVKVSISWKPLDSPTATGYADIELKQAQTASAYALQP